MEQAAQESTLRVMKEIKIKLTEADLLEKARSAAQFNKEVGELEEEITEHKKRIKALSDPKEAALKKHLEHIQEGFEHKTVEVEMRKDYAQGVVEYIYEGQVVETRNMDSEDRQLNLVTPESSVGTKSEDENIKDVMRAETNVRTKHDHITSDYDSGELSDEDLDPMSRKVHTLTHLTEATE